MAERQTTYDVAVVGGRIAGALSAILFAQAGARVVVVDRARFPSPTLSTHFFRGDGLVRVLAAAGVLDDVLGLGPPPLVREYAYLDGSVIRAGLVVGADGRRSTVARDVQAADHERHGGKRALYYRYVADMPGPVGGPPDGPEFSLRGDELVYVFPSDAGLTCVAVSVNLDEYDRMRHAAADRFDELLSRHCGVWDRYHASTPRGRLFGTGPQDDFVRQAAGPGWALVGDAGIHQDPWSGMGMDTAGVSAALLVEQVAAAGGPGGSDAWVAAYERSREVVLPAFHSTLAGAADLSGLFG